MAEGPAKIAGLPIQRNGLIHQMIVRGPLYLDRQMVPGIVVRMTGNARRNPVGILSVPNIPLVSACDAALVAKNEAHAAEELIDIKLQRLRDPEVISVEIHVIGEVVERRNYRLVAIRHTLRRAGADQLVVPQRVGVRSSASDPKHSRLTADRRRSNPLGHREIDPIAGRRRTVHKVRRSLPELIPAAGMLQIRE